MICSRLSPAVSATVLFSLFSVGYFCVKDRVILGEGEAIDAESSCRNTFRDNRSGADVPIIKDAVAVGVVYGNLKRPSAQP